MTVVGLNSYNVRRLERYLLAAASLLGVGVVIGALLRPTKPEATAVSTVSRHDLLSTSYREVLDATKHQDDKVGRFLTAIAFLMAAAIAFGVRADVLTIKYDLQRPLPLPAILFMVFFALVILSVVLLLFALGQALRLPSSTAPGRSSYLFFMSIADHSNDNWNRQWSRETSEIESDIDSDLVGEIRNLAIRADGKYQRSAEAQSTFTIGLLAFILGLVLSLKVLASGRPEVEPWNTSSRMITASVIGLFAFVLGYGLLRFEQKIDDQHRFRFLWVEAYWRRHGVLAIWILMTAYPVLLLLPGGTSRTTLAYSAGSCIALASLLVALRIRHLRVSFFLIVSMGMGLGVGSTVARLEQWNGIAFLMAALTAVWLELPRLMTAEIQWRRRLHVTEG